MTPRQIQLAGFALVLVGSILAMETSWVSLLLAITGAGLMIRATMIKCRECGAAVGRAPHLLLPRKCRNCGAFY
jgi:hypothetical protein